MTFKIKKYPQKIFLVATFSLIFFSSFFVDIALAEVTCCGCSGDLGWDPATGMEMHTGRATTEFVCAENSPECATICSRRDESYRPIERVRATGEVVTCCLCSDDVTKICNPVNQTCNILCGDHGFRSGSGLWKREPGDQIRPAATETTKDETSKVELMPPNLNIDIPGSGSLFGGGQIVKEGEERYFYLPYIGEYVSALYNYVLGIVGILAVVVIIFAGGIWLTAGGSPERIKTAQEYIFGAVTGVVLAFGSYLILYTINPDLVRFAAIKIKVVENIPWPDLIGTEELTGVTSDYNGQNGRGGGGTGGFVCRNRETGENPPPQAESGCTLGLTAPADLNEDPNRDQRTLQFVQNARSILTGTPREKVLQVARLAAQCGIHLGSCGRTVGIINALAGVDGKNIDSCLPNPYSDNCSNGHETNSISSARIRMEDIADMHCYPADRNGNYPANNPPGCLSGSESIGAVYQRLNGSMSTEWPNSWADTVQPGDIVNMYIGNSDRWGLHVAVFMGWDGDWAKLIEGGVGCYVKEGRRCLKEGCNPPLSIVRTFSPDR